MTPLGFQFCYFPWCHSGLHMDVASQTNSALPSFSFLYRITLVPGHQWHHGKFSLSTSDRLQDAARRLQCHSKKHSSRAVIEASFGIQQHKDFPSLPANLRHLYSLEPQSQPLQSLIWMSCAEQGEGSRRHLKEKKKWLLKTFKELWFLARLEYEASKRRKLHVCQTKPSWLRRNMASLTPS